MDLFGFIRKLGQEFDARKAEREREMCGAILSYSLDMERRGAAEKKEKRKEDAAGSIQSMTPLSDQVVE